ncbi:MAG: ankyrin repeat domain-containing protein [Treponema sp.]|nr:ankyrin repeat domain-containing protein [Treponema sp.]
MSVSEIFTAVKEGPLGDVKSLLEKGIDPNAKEETDKGFSLLHYAAGKGRPDVAKALLDAGADVDIRDNMGFTPFHLAVGNARMELIKILLDAGADVNAESTGGATALRLLAEGEEFLEVARVLIAAGVNADLQDSDGVTPLHVAIILGQLEIAKVILPAVKKIDAKDKDGTTALHFAAERGRLGIIQAILSAGADINAKDNDGYTAVQVATIQEHPEIVKVLLDAGNEMAWKHFKLGNGYYANGSHALAIEELTKALEYGHSSPRIMDVIHYSLGFAYKANKEYDKAIAYFTKPIETVSSVIETMSDDGALIAGFVTAVIERGKSYFLIGDSNKAAADFELALRTDPNNDEARGLLNRLSQ